MEPTNILFPLLNLQLWLQQENAPKIQLQLVPLRVLLLLLVTLPQQEHFWLSANNSGDGKARVVAGLQ